jgi:hypothetical protein
MPVASNPVVSIIIRQGSRFGSSVKSVQNFCRASVESNSTTEQRMGKNKAQTEQCLLCSNLVFVFSAQPFI